MIIIDQHAYRTLARKLQAFKEQPDSEANYQYVHFKLSEREMVCAYEDVRQMVLAAAERHIPADNLEIYLCEDKDIFLLAPDISKKDAIRMMLDVAALLQVPVTEEYAGLYDLTFNLVKLQVAIERKLDKLRAEHIAAQELEDKENAARKRQAILDHTAYDYARDIAAKRAARSEPQLMIIEDDAFSRRLVANVLQKEYALTALGTTERALFTYAELAPDVLFLDIDLPDVTGHELLERIIAFDPEAYVIMLSGNADKENIMQAMQLGAKGFIAKPFTREKLIQYISRCPTIKTSKGNAYA